MPEIGEYNDLQYNPDMSYMPLDCPAVWDLFHRGDTKGVFQLERQGYMSKKVAPNNIEELSDLISIIRPGVRNSFLKGKSLADHYVERKHGREPIEYIDDSLEEILKNTQGILCIHEDTYVSKYDGTECKIKNLSYRDRVCSIEQSDYKCVEDICNGISISPRKNGVRLTLENGFQITLTNDHKVYTQRGPVEVKNLEETDSIQIALQQYKYDTEKHIPIFDNEPRWYYLIGQLVGDGCSGSAISTGEEKNHLKLLRYLDENFPELEINPYFNVRSWYIRLSGKELLNSKNYGNRKTKYRKFVEDLGLDKTKNDKTIPENIFKSNSTNRQYFLAGLFDADGYSGKSNTGTAIRHFCSDNVENINGIRKLLSLEGIKSYISNDRKHIYAVDTIKFDRLIMSKCIIKTSKGNITSGAKYGSIHKSIIRERINNLGQKIKPFCRANNISESTMFENNFAHLSTAEKAGFEFGDISLMKVKKIERVKNQKFYSISIQNTHNLIGNGIVISNCYQEQAMQIAVKVAGFSLIEADNLRKAIGKKKADLMADMKVKFLDGTKKVGLVSDKVAEEIFSWIEASQRYSFNKSHGISYALNAYQTAYGKVHLPKEFYASAMRHADGKIDQHQEMYELISNAREKDIDVQGPSIKFLNDEATIVYNMPTFGLTDIKGFGGAAYLKFKQALKDTCLDVAECTFDVFLGVMYKYINKTSFEALIKSGALDCYMMGRNEMLHMHGAMSELKEREFPFIRNYLLMSPECRIVDAINAMRISYDPTNKDKNRPIARAARLEELDDVISGFVTVGYDLKDDIEWMATKEKETLGIPVTYSKVDNYDDFEANCNCRDFNKGFNSPHGIHIMGELNEFREYKIKNGKMKGETMCFLDFCDITGRVDNTVLFSDEYERFKPILQKGGVYLFSGVKDEKRGSIQIKNIKRNYDRKN